MKRLAVLAVSLLLIFSARVYAEPVEISTQIPVENFEVSQSIWSIPINQTFTIWMEINEEVSFQTVGWLLSIDKSLPPNLPILVVVNSVGGLTTEAFAICDVMRALKRPVYTLGIGKSWSGGARILAAGTRGHRYVTKNTIVMLHKDSYASENREEEKQRKLSKEEKQREEKEKQQQQILLDRVNERSIQYLSEVTGKTKEELYRDLAEEVWLFGEETVAYGVADHVLE